MKLFSFLAETLPLLQRKVFERADSVVEEGEVKIYWAGTVIRIDFKPKGETDDS